MIVCEFEDGGKGSLRHAVVGAIAINDNNEVLITKRASHLTGGNKYSIPGGFLDRDENTREAVLRELLEETGYVGEIVKLLRVEDSPNRRKENRQNVNFVYLVKVISGEPKLNSEVTEIKWFSEKDLPSEEEFAFDHRDDVMLYFNSKKQEIDFPIIGNIDKYL